MSLILARRLAAALRRGRPPAPVLVALGSPEAARRALDAGAALPEVLERYRLLPEPFAEAFRAADPAAVEGIAEAAACAERDRRRFRWVASGALGALMAVVVTLAFGTALGLRPLHEAVLEAYPDPPAGYQALYLMADRLFSGVGVLVQVALTLMIFVNLDRLWSRAPSGRRAGRAAAARGLAALLGAGLSADRALKAVASLAPHLASALRRGASRVAGGAPAGEVLAGLDLAPAGLSGLWSLAERPGLGGGGRLAELAEAFARLLEAERDARAPLTGRGFWIAQGVLAGLLVLTFGLSLVTGWLLVLPWRG